MSRANVWTFLRQDGEFVELAEARPVARQDYVEGAIVLEIDGEPVLDVDTWDDVNWLWSFLVDAIEDVRVGKAHTLRFPDQPLELRFLPRPGKGAWVRVEVSTKPPRGRSVEREKLVAAFKGAAIEYFEATPRFAPRNAGEADVLLKRVRGW
jgi:hypothetical protein